MHLHGNLKEDGHQNDDEYKSDYEADEKRAKEHPSEVHALLRCSVSDGGFICEKHHAKCHYRSIDQI